MRLGAFIVEMLSQLRIALPVCMTFLARKSVEIVSLVFVAHSMADSSHYLSSAGLATVTANVTGAAIVVGMAGALSTLASQANGARDPDELNLSLQRGLIIIPVCVCIPVSLLWMASRPIMVALGQEKDLARDAASYLLLLIPSLFFTGFNTVLQNWLYSQARTKAVAVIVIIIALLHPLWCYLLVPPMGFLGAGVAVSVTKGLETACLAAYLLVPGSDGAALLRDLQFQWDWQQATAGWADFIRLGVPNVIMMGEWVASEVTVFLAGDMAHADTKVSALTIYQMALTVAFMIPSGLAVSAATRCGNALGLADAEAAKTSAVAAPVLAGLTSVTVALLLLALHRVWLGAFTGDAAVIASVGRVLPVLAVYVVVDGVQVALTGIVKGLGKQEIGSYVVFFSYFLVGLPISVGLGFNWSQANRTGDGWGILGLAAGTTVGSILHCLLYAALVWRTDWPKEAQEVALRLRSITSSKEKKTKTTPDGEAPKFPPSIFDDDLDDADWNDSFESFANFKLHGNLLGLSSSASEGVDDGGAGKRPVMRRASTSSAFSSSSSSRLGAGVSVSGALASLYAVAAAANPFSQRQQQRASDYELVRTHLDALSPAAARGYGVASASDDDDDLLF